MSTDEGNTGFDYTLADLEEFDRLIERFCDETKRTPLQREAMRQKRRRMAPARVMDGLRAMRKRVG